MQLQCPPHRPPHNYFLSNRQSLLPTNRNGPNEAHADAIPHHIFSRLLYFLQYQSIARLSCPVLSCPDYRPFRIYIFIYAYNNMPLTNLKFWADKPVNLTNKTKKLSTDYGGRVQSALHQNQLALETHESRGPQLAWLRAQNSTTTDLIVRWACVYTYL